MEVPADKILQAINHTFATDVPSEFIDVYLKAFSL